MASEGHVGRTYRAGLWSITFLTTGTTVRTRVTPIEFTRLPRGLAVASQSDEGVQVQIRGNAWLPDSVNLDTMTAPLDLAPLQAGSHTLVMAPENVNAPHGVSVVNVTPRQITVRLERQEPPNSR